jgi:hypothetical protein
MPRYRRITTEVEASQWFQNGDHPKDGPSDMEGRVVRYYRTPDTPGRDKCRGCGHYMYDHGWIDQENMGVPVCPGDWVVTNRKDKYKVYDDCTFRYTYEPVE